MRHSELVVALDSLRYDIEQSRVSKRNVDYYSDVLGEACNLINNLDR